MKAAEDAKLEKIADESEKSTYYRCQRFLWFRKRGVHHHTPIRSVVKR